MSEGVSAQGAGRRGEIDKGEIDSKSLRLMRLPPRQLVGALASALWSLFCAQTAFARIAFSPSLTFEVAAGASAGPQAMRLADVSLDAERKLDLLVVNSDNNSVDVFLGDEELSEISDAEFSLADGDGTPIAVTTGNFDASGSRLVDLAVLTRDPGRVRIFRSTPDPDDPDNEDLDPDLDFTVVDTALTFDGDPRALVVGRFNNDTRDDIAVLTATQVYIFLSNGDASFQRQNPVSINGSSAFLLVAQDLNDDQFDDVVVTDPGDQQIKVLTSSSSGALSFRTAINAGTEPRGITAADYDANGTVDLLVSDASSDGFDSLFYLFPGLGGADFDSPEGINAGSAFPYAVATFDVDRDGTLDVVSTSISPDVEASTLFCQPSGEAANLCDTLEQGEPPLEAGLFRQPRADTIPRTDSAQVAVVTGELSGDRLDDIILLSDDGSAAVLMINGSTSGSVTPTPTGGVVMTPTPTGPTPTATITRTPTPSPTGTGVPIPYGECRQIVEGRPVAVAVGDFDNGTSDIAYADQTGNRIGLLTSHRTSGSSACDSLGLTNHRTVATVTAPSALLPADLDRDGRLDLVAIGSSPEVVLLFGSGDGNFTAVRLPTSDRPAAIAIADFDRDLNPDVVVANGTGKLSLFLGAGGGQFGSACTINQGVLASVLATDQSNGGDLNGDGWPDLIVGGSGSGTTSVLLRRKPSTPPPAGQCVTEADFTISSLDTRSLALLAGQFEAPGNNLPDIISLNSGGEVWIFDGRPSSSTAGVTYAAPRLVDSRSGINAIATGNFFGLRRADLAYTVSSANEERVLKANGDGTYTKGEKAITVGSLPVAIAVGDLDGDLRDDTVTANSGDGTLSILLSRFAPTPTPTTTPTVTSTVPTTTPTPSPTPSPSTTPSRTLSPTRTQTPSQTPTVTPTQTGRGLFQISDSSCALAPGAAGASMLPIWAGLAAVLMSRRASRNGERR